MPNLLSEIINPKYDVANYPGREKMLSQVGGQGYNRAPAPPPAPSTAVQPRPQEEYAWQKTAQEDKEKQAISGALSEIVKTRDETGQPFLPSMQRMQIFSKHGIPSQIADKFNAIIDKAESKAEQKETEKRNKAEAMTDPTHMTTRTLPDGSTSTTAESLQNLIDNPVVTPLSRKEKLLNKVLDEKIHPASLTAIERALLGIKKEKTADPIMREMGGTHWQWNSEKEEWVDTGKKEVDLGQKKLNAQGKKFVTDQVSNFRENSMLEGVALDQAATNFGNRKTIEWLLDVEGVNPRSFDGIPCEKITVGETGESLWVDYWGVEILSDSKKAETISDGTIIDGKKAETAPGEKSLPEKKKSLKKKTKETYPRSRITGDPDKTGLISEGLSEGLQKLPGQIGRGVAAVSSSGVDAIIGAAKKLVEMQRESREEWIKRQ